MNPVLRNWAPAALLVSGAILTTAGVKGQRRLDLRVPLDSAVPAALEGFTARTVTLSDDEIQVAGVTSYLARTYVDSAATDSTVPGFTLYVGYYDRQTQGKTIHSPKNCLPGAGWEALTSRTAEVATAQGPVTVNSYLIQNGPRRALVYYWYQGRGRIVADEYAVKWNLLRDAALRRRSDEALVRVVVPVSAGEPAAEALAARVSGLLVPRLLSALPL